MSDSELPAAEVARIDELVRVFVANLTVFETFHKQLRSVVEDAALTPLIHSIKSRVKDPDHLRDKLERKVRKALLAGTEFGITEANLFERINDLVGLRLLHLHTRQLAEIDHVLRELLAEHRFDLIEVSARTWDLESKAYFDGLGIPTQDSSSLYTSVHYVVDPGARTRRTAEIQVRTLAEEIWGEVDHTINYPHESDNISCKEQIKALARATSTCSRLVDSIFTTHALATNVTTHE